MNTSAIRSRKPGRGSRWLPLIAGVAVLFVTLACDLPDFSKFWDSEDSPRPVSQPEPPKRHSLQIESYSVNRFRITVGSPGPPYPKYVELKWTTGGDGIHASHQQYLTGQERRYESTTTYWRLPVDPATGKTETVIVSYDLTSSYDSTSNSFQAYSDMYEERSRQDFSQSNSWDGSRTGVASAAPSGCSDAGADAYYRWGLHRYLYPGGETAMTPALCETWRDLAQSEQTFFALRFPILPPPLAGTEPYTLPLVIGGLDGSSAALAHDPGGSLLPTPLS